MIYGKKQYDENFATRSKRGLRVFKSWATPADNAMGISRLVVRKLTLKK